MRGYERITERERVERREEERERGWQGEKCGRMNKRRREKE